MSAVAGWEHEARGPGGKWIELYHGTTSAKAVSIKASGMTASRYSHYNSTLTVRKDEAGYFAGAHGAVVTVRIPADQMDEYTEGNSQGLVSLRKPLPPSMIHKVDHMDPRDARLARPASRRMIDLVGPRGYVHGWIKVGAGGELPQGQPDVRAANAALAKTGVLKRATRQNMSVGGGLAVAGGSSDTERPVADALTGATQTGKDHYVIPTAMGLAATRSKSDTTSMSGYIQVTPAGDVTKMERPSFGKPAVPVARLSDHTVASVLDRQLSKTVKAQPRTTAPKAAVKDPDVVPRSAVARLVKDMKANPALLTPEYKARAKTVAGKSGASDLIPSDWAGDQPALELSAQTARLASTPAPAGKPGGPGLYRVKGMELPPYFQNVRNALIRSGHPPAEAYQITWGAIRRWARGGGKAHPEVVAAARAALAALAADSARAHAHSNPAREAITLAKVATGAQVNIATGATGPLSRPPSSGGKGAGGGGSGFDSLHPRVGAGNTGGGRFAKKGSGTTAASGSSAKTAKAKTAAKPKAAGKTAAKTAAAPAAGKATTPKMNATPAKPKTPAKAKAAPKPAPKPTGRAAKLQQKTQLQTQARNDRAKAKAINVQIAQLTAAIHTAVKAAAASTASTAATKTAATAAKTAAATTTAAAKTAATAATTTATTTASTTAKTTSSVPAMRAKRAGLRVQAHTLVVRANTLDKQAAAIHLTAAGPAAALELAGAAPFREELARRVPAGKPGGGRFAEPADRLTRHATPDQTAVAVNRLAPDQRAVCRATVLPPPGYEWGGTDRLIPTSGADLAGSARAIELVGPKGYIHGWIRPGGPAPPTPAAKKPATVGHVVKAHSQSTAYTDAKFAELETQIGALHKQMADMQDSKETHDAKLKIASHIGVAAAGGILSCPSGLRKPSTS